VLSSRADLSRKVQQHHMGIVYSVHKSEKTGIVLKLDYKNAYYIVS
jgi:hypothetical protein